jgi:hypothetical protein
MRYKREEDKKTYMRVWNRFKRLWVDIVVLCVMFGLSFLLPNTPEEAAHSTAQMNLLALFITKTNAILWAWLLVDFARTWKYPYIDLQVYIDDRNWAGVVFLSTIYFVVIYAMAVGG